MSNNHMTKTIQQNAKRHMKNVHQGRLGMSTKQVTGPSAPASWQIKIKTVGHNFTHIRILTGPGSDILEADILALQWELWGPTGKFYDLLGLVLLSLGTSLESVPASLQHNTHFISR